VPRRRVPRARDSVISKLRSHVLERLRVIYEDGDLLVSPSLDDGELERVLLEILGSGSLSFADIQRVFSGVASSERVRRALDNLARRGAVRFENGVYVAVPEKQRIFSVC
jgi:hypothetical protein